MRKTKVKKIIYDFGCHNGSNIAYYLLKSDVVVAVDANPELCETIRIKFKKEIQQHRLIVENCIITTEPSGTEKSFYIFEPLDVCSTILPETKLFYKNKRIQKSDYKEIKVVQKNILELIQTYGRPFYIKIDLEHYDHVILKEIFLSNIRPQYISSECHNIEVFNLMLNQNDYKYFKLVKGNFPKFLKYKIRDYNGFEIEHRFDDHSAGPCCEDIEGNWLEKDMFKKIFFLNGGPSWVDIHALRSN